jgi:hypothetical protein
MRENDLRRGMNLWQKRFEWLGWFRLSRDPSPFDFAQGQDDGKNKDGKTEKIHPLRCGVTKKNKQQQMQMRGFFAALRMTTLGVI